MSRHSKWVSRSYNRAREKGLLNPSEEAFQAPPLVNEIMHLIAEEAANLEFRYENIDREYPGCVVLKESSAWRWELYRTSTVFAEEARKVIYRKVHIDRPESFERSIQVLSSPQIARCIRSVKLKFDEDYWKPLGANNGTPISTFMRYDSHDWKDTSAVNLSANDFSAGLRQLFIGCKNLEEFTLSLAIAAQIKYDIWRFCEAPLVEFRHILSRIDLPNLRLVETHGMSLVRARALWDIALDAPQISIANRNLLRLRRLDFRPNCFATDGDSNRPRYFEDFLRTLTLEDLFLSYSHVRYPSDVVPADKLCFPHHMSCDRLAVLGLSGCIGRGLSDFLFRAGKDGRLRKLRLAGCKLHSQADRWEKVFSACIELPLEELEVNRLGYWDGDESCRPVELCSPFKEDGIALRLLGDELVSRRVKAFRQTSFCTDPSHDDWVVVTWDEGTGEQTMQEHVSDRKQWAQKNSVRNLQRKKSFSSVNTFKYLEDLSTD